MLRRALAGHHHHLLCIVHSQRLSRATTTLLSSAPPDSQNNSTSARHQPFSISRVCRLRRGGASKNPPRRLANSQNSPSHVVGTSGGPSQPSPPIPEAQADTGGGDDVRVPDPDVVVGNSTNKKRVLRGDDGDHAAQGEANPAQANRASTRPRTTHARTRTLRPLVFPPSFPPIPLLPTTNAPITDQDQSEQKATADDKTDAAGSSSSSSSTTIAVGALPPDTLKTDIRSVFQPFGEVKRIFVHPGGRRADVVFADVESVRRALHAYAEEPLCVRGHEVVVFRRGHHHARSAGVNGRGAVASRRPFYVRHEQDDDDGAKEGVVFVSNFPAGTTQEELSEVLAPLGKYEHFVMRMCLFVFSPRHSLSSPTRREISLGPGSRYAYFMYSSNDSVETILRVHERVPITFRGQPLRIERTKNRPYNSSTESAAPLVELETPTSNALVEELKKTVPGWKGSCGPSRVLWVGRLPHDIPREALTNFWSRLGCVVEVRACA